MELGGEQVASGGRPSPEQLGSAPPGGSSENAEWQWRHPVAAGPRKHSCT